MLTIREKQFNVLREYTWSYFRLQLSRNISRYVAACPADQRRFDVRLDKALEMAVAEHLTSGPSLAFYVCLVFDFGPAFARRPHIRAYLDRVGPDRDQAFMKLLERVPIDCWYRSDPVALERQWAAIGC